MGFEFTPQLFTISDRLWAITSIVGAAFCFIVLVAIAVISTHRKARAHLDRVSFRIMLYALLTNLVFGSAGGIGGLLEGPSILCGLSVFALQLSLQASSLLLFCIALNLQLVVVHDMNGQMFEKYYVAGSIALALAVSIPPYAAGQYGWDPLENQCWYTNDNRARRIAWQVGTQLVWTGLTSICEAVAAFVVTSYMLRVHLRRKIAGATYGHESSGAKKANRPRPPSLSPTVIHAQVYKKIILRIALYPMASCIINLTSIATVIHSTVSNGIKTKHDYNILLLSDFLYGGRAIVYAILAATDPAFIRAARVFAGHYFGTSGSTASPADSSQKNKLAIHIELSTIHSTGFELPPAEREMDQALALKPTFEQDDKVSSESSSPEVTDVEQGFPATTFRRQPSTRRSSGQTGTEIREEDEMEEFAKRI